MKHIYLVRHCQAAGQAADAPLTEEGVRQAERLADFLQDKGIRHIVSSPFLRAVSSIQPLAERLGLNVHQDERLTERVLSTAPLENWLELLERTYSDDNLRFEGGESSGEAAERGMRVVSELIARPEDVLLLVTHGALLSLLIRSYRKEFGFHDWKLLSNPDVYRLALGDTISIEQVWQQ